MGRKIALFCALVGVLVLVAGSAYAEVQNIKVSGDIQALAVYRENYDLEDSRNWEVPENADGTSWYLEEDTDSFLMSIVRLRVDADLTDNVAATVRLANLREWDSDCTESADIILDLAYITLKEMLYSPLTMIIGRQELHYGSGLIVGYGLYQDPNGSISYRDLSPLHGYDAIRAILDYDPWVLNIVAAKMVESDDNTSTQTATPGVGQDRDADRDLYGVNLGYTFDQYDAEMEAYLWYKRDETYNMTFALAGFADNSPSNSRVFEEALTYTSGVRGSVVPIDNLTLAAEIAGQWGEINDKQAGSAGSGADDNPLSRDRAAMLADVSGQYNFADVRFNPVVGVEYLYVSGEEAANEGDFDAWNPIYRGKTLGTIRSCQELLYVTNDPADTSAFTNQHTVKASGSLDLGELVDGLSLDLAYLHYWFDEEVLPGADDEIGDELNLTLTYDYTEDVQFLLDGALFIPGDYYDDVHTYEPMAGGDMALSANEAQSRVSNDNAISIVGSCKVTF